MSTAGCLDWTDEHQSLYDVLIVGSGISGTLAAAILGRDGCRVCLIDRHASYPPDFRAEHLDGPQIEQLRRLGFLDDLTAGLYRGETVALARFGRVVGAARTVNYGLRYDALVNRARTALPPNVAVVTGRVVAVQTGSELQQVQMAGGRRLTGRLIILATGQGHALCKQTGTTRRIIREAHSLTFGFDIKPVGDAPFTHSFLVYQRERIEDRIDYLAAFTMGSITRVNLFTYRHYHEPWTKALLTAPAETLTASLPGFTKVFGGFCITGPVVARPIDLYAATNYKKDGVVLVGDAFQSSCPATGMGIVKLLTDVEQLCTLHIPRWLATPGMAAAKIAQFYDDPIKQACDAKAMHDAEYRRSVSTNTSLPWHIHRLRVDLMQHLSTWRTGVGLQAHPRIHQDELKAAQRSAKGFGIAG